MKLVSADIRGFRSLYSMRLPSLNPVTLIYGANNAGKSNVLAAFRVLMAAKEATTLGSVPQDDSVTRSTPWYYGTMGQSADDFSHGLDLITFEIRIDVSHGELLKASNDTLPIEISESLGHDHHLEFEGHISRVSSGGEMRLTLGKIDKTVFYRFKDGAEDFFGSKVYGGMSDEARRESAESVLGYFTDCVAVIGSDRFLSKEPPGRATTLSSSTFKRWLLAKSLSREGHQVYAQICDAFKSDPFRFGDISFAEDGDGLDIMITDRNGHRLPVGSLGTGVQQILFVLAAIISARAPVIGIEELELNLSTANQDDILTQLRSFVESTRYSPTQLLITSHSGHLATRGDVGRLIVEKEDGASTARRLTSIETNRLFPRLKFGRSVP